MSYIWFCKIIILYIYFTIMNKILIIIFTIWILFCTNGITNSYQNNSEEILEFIKVAIKTDEQFLWKDKNNIQYEDRIKILENDKLITEKFNSFSIKDKHKILSLLRQYNSINNETQQVIVNDIYDKIQINLEKQWKFLLDLQEREIKNLFLEEFNKNNFTKAVLSCSAPLVSYPTAIYYKDKISTDTEYHWRKVRNVKNDPNESVCDTEVSFLTIWDYVWADIWTARQMITLWFWWVLHSRNEYERDYSHLIVWFWTSSAFWFTDTWLLNRLKLLK